MYPQTQEEVYVLIIMLYIFQTFGEVANIVYDDSAPSVIISYVSRQQAEKVSLINLVKFLDYAENLDYLVDC